MKINLLILFVVMSIAALITLYTNSAIMLPPEPETTSKADVGTIVPNFSFVSLDGSSMSIRELNGKIVLINFWASWCAPCIEEFPQLYNLADTMPKNLALLAISADENREELERFLSKTGQKPDNVYIVWDKNKAISQDMFQTVRLPETIILGPDQRMVDKVIGAAEWDSDEMKTRLKAILN